MKILIAEDEVSLSNAVKKLLEQQGHIVDAVYDGRSAVEYACGMDYSVIILDVMMPEIDGFEAIRQIRKNKVGTPVLMLTALSTTRDKVSGLNFGADDYMTKPFEPEELLARVAALSRRKGEVVVDTLTYSDLELNVNSAVLSCRGKSVQLSRKEFDVLQTFLYNPTMTVPTDTLINNVWGIDSDATDNNVEVYISFIRKKLKFLGSNVNIKKVPRIGYRLEVRS